MLGIAGQRVVNMSTKRLPHDQRATQQFCEMGKLTSTLTNIRLDAASAVEAAHVDAAVEAAVEAYFFENYQVYRRVF
jgi:hypothetical protein